MLYFLYSFLFESTICYCLVLFIACLGKNVLKIFFVLFIIIFIYFGAYSPANTISVELVVCKPGCDKRGVVVYNWDSKRLHTLQLDLYITHISVTN